MPESDRTNYVYACLLFLGKELDPQEITRSLKIPPSRSFLKGDIHGADISWPHGYWELCSKEFIRNTDLSVHLAWLAGKVEAVKDEICAIVNRSGISSKISCFWIMGDSNEVLILNAALLRKLADLGIEVSIDVYSPD